MYFFEKPTDEKIVFPQNIAEPLFSFGSTDYKVKRETRDELEREVEKIVREMLQKGQLRRLTESSLPNIQQNLQKSHDDSTELPERGISDFRNEIKTKVQVDVDRASLKALEKERKNLVKKVKTLELTLSEWETRQFTNLKLISGFY